LWGRCTEADAVVLTFKSRIIDSASLRTASGLRRLLELRNQTSRTLGTVRLGTPDGAPTPQAAPPRRLSADADPNPAAPRAFEPQAEPSDLVPGKNLESCLLAIA
jgi:hypothetical protein